MNELLGNGTSALLAFQRAIRTTSHNIANVNTEGYSRQRVLLEAAPPSRDGGGFDGNGVRVAGVERIASGFAAARVHETTAAHSREATHHELASRLDALFADGALDPSESFGRFFAALEDASLDPSSTTSRELALRSGEEVAARMRTLQGELDGTAREVDGRRRAGVERVNELSTGIAELNGRIVEHRAGGRQQLASDLLDQRDRLVGELSAVVDVETFEQDDGAMNVSIGDGIALVTGRRASPLRSVEDATRPGRSDIEVGNGVTWQPVGARLQGGELGGLEAFETDTLEPAMQRLGRLAQAFAAGVDEAHAQGVTLDGSTGGDWFEVGAPIANSAAANSGSAELGASIVDASQLAASDYRLRFDGAAWEITRTSDGTRTSGATLPTSIDGLDIAVTGSPATGDTFLVSATRSAAGTLRSTLTDPAALALAEPGAGEGGNGNARALAALGSAGLVNGATIAEDIGAMAGSVGGTTATLATRSAALETMRGDAVERRDSISGVNLDEEAIDLARHEQAYQAAAQVIRTADELFQTVLGVVAR